MWGERPGGSFTVNQERLLSAVHHVLLHLGDVVRNVVDDVHVEVVRRRAEHFGEGLKNNKLTLGPLQSGNRTPAEQRTCLVRKVMDERLTQA